MKLSLPNVQLEDEGTYSCENQIGESEEIKIIVTGTIQFINRQLYIDYIDCNL